MKSIYSILFIAALAACSNRSDYADKMIFRYNESAGITSLDPAYSRNLENLWACNMLFNSLVEVDDSLNVRPALAKSWSIDSSGTCYRFVLRGDVYFHSNPCFPDTIGRRLVAADVVYSFDRIRSAKTSSPGGWVFSNVAAIDPFAAIGDSVVEINLKQAFPPFWDCWG